jgi:hypothetical protein
MFCTKSLNSVTSNGKDDNKNDGSILIWTANTRVTNIIHIQIPVLYDQSV